MYRKIELFKNREIKAKQIFTIKEIDRSEGFDFIKKYHYLKDSKYLSMYNYGLFIEDVLVGVATYSLPQGTMTLKNWFNINDNSYREIQELMRLCVIPELNKSNATSYLLRNSSNLLRKTYGVRAVITLADSKRHVGSIYQVSSFKYYGLTKKETDFYSADGRKGVRGKLSEMHGCYVARTQKHRYAIIYDEKLNCNHKEVPYPKQDMRLFPNCCNGTKQVYDKRFNETFTCPLCVGKLKFIKEGK